MGLLKSSLECWYMVSCLLGYGGKKHAIRLQNKEFASGYNSSLPIPVLGSASQWLKSCGLLEFMVQWPKRGHDKETSPDSDSELFLTRFPSVAVISFASFHPTPGCWYWQPLAAAGVYYSTFLVSILLLLLSVLIIADCSLVSWALIFHRRFSQPSVTPFCMVHAGMEDTYPAFVSHSVMQTHWKHDPEG